MMPNVEDVSTDSLYRKALWRIIPLVGAAMFVNMLDRINLSFAAVEMNAELGMSARIYGLGAGIFFIGYILFEVPSNIILARVGARRWIARIMISWGLLSMAMAFIVGPWSFVVVRFLLGFAEAGFFPGILYYLHQWFPRAHVGRALALFAIFTPLASALGAPLSVGLIGWLGWRAMFVVEGLPAVLLGFVILWKLADSPLSARWLLPAEKQRMTEALKVEQPAADAMPIRSALKDPATLAMALQYFLLLAPAYALTLWLPTVVRNLGISAVQTGWFVALPNALGAVALMIYAWRFKAAVDYLLPVLLTVTAIGLLAGSVFTSPLPILACFCVATVGLVLSNVAFWARPRGGTMGAGAAAAMALCSACGNVGGLVGPTAVGFIFDMSGTFDLALAAGGASLALAAAMSLVIHGLNTRQLRLSR